MSEQTESADDELGGQVEAIVMLWSSSKPTEPGWYWMRQPMSHLPDEEGIVYVRDYCGKMCLMNWEIPNNAEWAGPIPMPVGTQHPN